MKIFESIFGEGVKVQALTPEHIKQLKPEAMEYVKDWSTDSFSIKFSFEDQNGEGKLDDIDEFSIPNARGLVALLADGIGVSVEEKSVKDSDVNEIFSFLKGLKGDVKSDRQIVISDGRNEPVKVAYKYQIKSFKYVHGSDFIDIDGAITNIDVL